MRFACCSPPTIGVFAKTADKAVEVGIVERPGNGVGAEAEQPEHVAGDFPVAEMPGDDERRPAREYAVEDRRRPADVDEIFPVVGMHAPRHVHHFHDHDAKMQVAAAHEVVDLGLGKSTRKGLAQIVLGHLPMPLIDVIGKPGKQAREPASGRER